MKAIRTQFGTISANNNNGKSRDWVTGLTFPFPNAVRGLRSTGGTAERIAELKWGYKIFWWALSLALTASLMIMVPGKILPHEVEPFMDRQRICIAHFTHASLWKTKTAVGYDNCAGRGQRDATTATRTEPAVDNNRGVARHNSTWPIPTRFFSSLRLFATSLRWPEP
ncbi:hypothetical protein B0H14DRAFT_2634000 [Mycena olivaceomarginata]|nr:hypothetical protein B0H14DRAFT_2634000 [Mycena olivaceomarginata]